MQPKIVDNFLLDDELNYINGCLNEARWNIQTSKLSSLQFLYYDVGHIDYFSNQLYKKLEEEIGIGLELERVYFNGQHSGREGELHSDGCDITALIYISEYNTNWGGFTQIVYSPTDQYIIPPLQKRLLLFDGRIQHKGYSYSYQDTPMRVSLAYKLHLKND